MLADVKTVTALGAYASGVLTAVTVQDAQAVHEVQAIDPLLVERQLQCVLRDIGADAIKLGMLGSRMTLELVTRVCEAEARHVPIVLDPVLESSTGAALLEESALLPLVQRLLPRVALVTPNVPEATRLTGVSIESAADLSRAADALLCLGAGAVLLKGGHLPGEQVVDLLRTADGYQREFEAPRVERQARGTGCTLASAVAAGLAEGMTLEGAVQQAEDFVQQALNHPAQVPSARPPLFHAFGQLKVPAARA